MMMHSENTDLWVKFLPHAVGCGRACNATGSEQALRRTD
jgi:hypothetical protein